MSIRNTSAADEANNWVPAEQQNLRQTVISATGWSGMARIGVQLLNLTIVIILMRLLSPEMFGIMGIITIFVGFTQLFSDFGLGAAIVQRERLEPAHLSSAFWFNLAAGLCLTLAFTVLSPVVAQFYSQAILMPLMIAVSLNFVVDSLGIVQRSILIRRMDFRRLSFAEILSCTLGGGVGISLALLGFGVWSLVGQSLLISSSRTLFVWIVSAWRPNRLFHWRAIRDLWRFGAYLVGIQTILYWVRNFDNLLIGRVLGVAELGFYTRAYSLMLLPIGLVSSSISKVLFPAFSSIQHDKERIARGYLRVTQVVAFITFPLMAGLLVVSENFVFSILGEQWIDLIPLMRVLCLVGLVESISTFNGTIYQSQGRTDLQFRVALVVGLISIVAIVVGLQWGVLGVAIAYATYSLVVTYPTMVIALSLVGLKFSTVVKNLTGNFACTATMALAVWALSLFLPSEWAHWIKLIVQAMFGVIIYLSLAHLLRIQAYIELRELLWERRSLRSQEGTNAPGTIPMVATTPQDNQ